MWAILTYFVKVLNPFFGFRFTRKKLFITIPKWRLPVG